MMCRRRPAVGSCAVEEGVSASVRGCLRLVEGRGTVVCAGPNVVDEEKSVVVVENWVGILLLLLWSWKE